MDLEGYLEAIKSSNETLAQEIRTKNNVSSSSVEAYSFIIGALKILHPYITNEQLHTSITDDDYDEQIDAVVISENRIYIYDFKLSVGFSEKDIKLFKESVDTYVFKTDGELENCNKYIRKIIPNVVELLNAGEHKVVLRVVRGGGNSFYDQGKKALDKLNYDSIDKKELISLKDLIDIELSFKKSPIKYDLTITAATNNKKDTNSQIIIKEKNNIASLICRIPLKELVDFYYDFEPNSDDIFQSNVRGLQNNKKVTTEIIQSLSNSEQAKQFYKLHNGIAIVCDSIQSIRNDRYKLENPQIVNGCQTVTTISRYFQSNRDSKILLYGTVIAKVFAATTDQVEKICFASNSQVAINPWDLRTNDQIQIVIESFLNKKGILYNRKATRIGAKNDLLFKDLGQILCATLLEKPADAKNARAKIFSNESSSLYKSIFSKDLKLNDVYDSVRFAIYVKKRIKLSTSEEKKIFGPANLHIIAAFYFLRDRNLNEDQKYIKITKVIKNIVTEMQKKDVNLTPPIIFTKHESIWLKLKEELELIKSVVK